MLEDCHLQEWEKQVNYFLLFVKLLDDLLAEIVLSALMILLFLLLLSLLLLHIDSHIWLVLILLDFILDNTSLDFLKRLSSLFLQGDYIVADQVHNVEAFINNQILFIKKHLHVIGIFVTISIHHIMESHDEILDAFNSEVGLNWGNIQAQEGSHEMLKTAHLNKFVAPLVGFLIFTVSSINLAHDLERIEKLIDRLGV